LPFVINEIHYRFGPSCATMLDQEKGRGSVPAIMPWPAVRYHASAGRGFLKG
jgi:hypothetical protein